MPELDDFDRGIIQERQRKLLDSTRGPIEGDIIRFADGKELRIGHIWRDENGKPEHIQTTRGGSFHLSGSGHMSYSGGFDVTVPGDTLGPERTTMKLAPIWIFHHDQWKAHNAVYAEVHVYVWDTTTTEGE